MTYNRLLCRNSLGGNYTQVRQYIQPDGTWFSGEDNKLHYANTEMMPGRTDDRLQMISGDLRRLEQDSLQPGYRREQIAKDAGVDEETVVKVLNAFFENHEGSYCKLPNVPPHDIDWGAVRTEDGAYRTKK